MKRILFSSKTVFQFSTVFSFLSLILSVACLTVALLAFNTVSSSLEHILIERQGHLRIQSETPRYQEEILNDLEPYKDFFLDQSLFLSFEGLVVSEGHFKGVLFEAIQDDKLKSSSFLNKRIVRGDLHSSKPFLIIGSDLEEELQLSSQASLRVVVSQSKGFEWSRQQSQFKVGAIADFGQHDLNTSFVLLPLSSVRTLNLDHVSGLNIWLKDKNQLNFLKQKMTNTLKHYFIQSWKDQNASFFSIIESDKKIIFFVLLILIISAGFNVSSSLFVQVFRKTKDISILKAMGAKKQMIRNVFVLNGMVIGVIGSAIGILTGVFLCYLLIFIQNKWRFIPAKVYHVNELVWDWQSFDLFLIFISSLIVVIISSLLPARQAAKMNVTTGLSYD